MKRALLVSVILLLIPQTVSASVNVQTTGDSNVTVNQETKGESTTCINGACTTTGGESHSKVCVNGKCYESDGDLEVNEGNAQINIKKSDTSSSVSVKNSSNTDSTGEVNKDSEEDEDEKEEQDSRENEDQSEVRQNMLQIIAGLFKSLFSLF